MRTAFTELVGVEHPLVAFERSPGVVVEASKAGAFGVLAATAYTPTELDAQLTWIEEQLDGRPYGVDLLVPEQKVVADRERLVESLRAQIPQQHIDFVESLMQKYDVPALPEGATTYDPANIDASVVPRLLEVCFRHDIALIANALGTPPAEMIAGARAKGVPVASLVGKPQHAERQLAAGVDVLIAQGYEAGGHTGDIATMVLTPEILDLAGDTPVLTAGGIGSGRQLAAALTLGAAGGWAGSVWLSTVEDVAVQAIKDKLLAATSSDTERNRTRTGKPARQLVSAWHREWAAAGLPALPMPLQPMLTIDAWSRIDAASEQGHEGALELESFFVGQIVGGFRGIRTTRQVVADIVSECEERLRAAGRLVEPARI
ncbi:NAD(P)H-dependent flavin oxidoreductase [Microbacterium sp. No. 7]|uniref:NAD(P)H-dependent flavin oxidoreductase n=1 Tax=Microbacterium sp. No. 7 TaxID=1714373 RepID=UPI0006D1A09A|nr:nitronate monooxygenase [Microbacterium sp. No. 7]ALJ21721.1 monooxygenase [Microbacterium sp. No. 7]